MKRLIFILFCFLTLHITAETVNQKNLIELGNKSFADKNYAKAIESYEKVLLLGYEAPELYYNLGNSYYKVNRFVDAILSFERAKLLAPNDEDIQFNLALMQKHVVDKIEILPEPFFSRWLSVVRNLLSSNQWAIISMVSFVLSLLLISFYLYSANLILRKSGFFTAIIVLIICSFSFISAYSQRQKLLIRNYAIIYTPVVTVKSSPGNDGTALFNLHEGTKVKINNHQADWIEIKLANGSVGWLKKTDVREI